MEAIGCEEHCMKPDCFGDGPLFSLRKLCENGTIPATADFFFQAFDAFGRHMRTSNLMPWKTINRWFAFILGCFFMIVNNTPESAS